jgi:hypothetical protein
MIIADIHFSRLDQDVQLELLWNNDFMFQAELDPGGDYSDCYMLVFSVGRII